MVIFSHDRPARLYAFLRSLDPFRPQLGKVTVIYEGSSWDILSGYSWVQGERFNVGWVRPRDTPSYQFRPQLVRSIFEGESDYVIFAEDDLVCIDQINFERAAYALEKTNAHAFFFSLGSNIEPCDPLLPASVLTPIGLGIYSWSFNEVGGEFANPFDLGMTLFRKEDLKQPLREHLFDSGDSFRQIWDKVWPKRDRGLCFGYSKVIHVEPDSFTDSMLLYWLFEGFVIEPASLYGLRSSSTYVCAPVEFRYVGEDIEDEDEYQN